MTSSDIDVKEETNTESDRARDRFKVPPVEYRRLAGQLTATGNGQMERFGVRAGNEQMSHRLRALNAKTVNVRNMQMAQNGTASATAHRAACVSLSGRALSSSHGVLLWAGPLKQYQLPTAPVHEKSHSVREIRPPWL